MVIDWTCNKFTGGTTAVKVGNRGTGKEWPYKLPLWNQLIKEKPQGNKKMSRESRMLVYPIRLFFPVTGTHISPTKHIF